jgi:pimeloyl-ACP methyl ester carboxylesterase
MSRWPRAHVGIALAAALSLIAVATSARRQPPRPAHEARRVAAGGLQLRYVRAGRGMPVVLIHGYGESLLAWRGLFDQLSAGADVIALDLPGFGLSDKPGSGYQAEALARTVLAALDSLGVARAVLVGHSMGGGVAAAAALAAPQRVAALVLVDPAVVSAPFLPDSTRADRTQQAARVAIAEYEALRTHFDSPHDPSWLGESDSALGYLPATDSTYRTALTAVLREFDFGLLTPERAARLRQPVLILWGEFDTVVPIADGRRLVEWLPDARFEMIPRSWHRPHVERPGETSTAIRGFLRSLSPSATGSDH